MSIQVFPPELSSLIDWERAWAREIYLSNEKMYEIIIHKLCSVSPMSIAECSQHVFCSGFPEGKMRSNMFFFFLFFVWQGKNALTNSFRFFLKNISAVDKLTRYSVVVWVWRVSIYPRVSQPMREIWKT